MVAAAVANEVRGFPYYGDAARDRELSLPEARRERGPVQHGHGYTESWHLAQLSALTVLPQDLH